MLKVVDVIAGKDARLPCQVKENGVNISWLKNNKTFRPSDQCVIKFYKRRFAYSTKPAQ